MNRIGVWSGLLFGVLMGWGGRANALPGQPVLDVASWMQSQPTIQPAPGESLLVHRTDSPSRRFTFQALITAPGRATASDGKDIIRSECITLFDTVYGVSQQRLEESLNLIYGPDLYQDYRLADVVYQYPTLDMVQRAQAENIPLLQLTQGEVRQGKRFAYWVETVQTPRGLAQNGRVTIFLLEDLSKLTAELGNR